MGNKLEVKYDDLMANYNMTTNDVDSLFEIIELINKEFQNLSNCWESNLASSFSEFAVKFKEYSDNNILNLKNTEEYKKYSVFAYKENESANINMYYEK